MKFFQILKDLQNSRSNGVYIELPEFRSNERIYVSKNGDLFHEKRFKEKTIVIPTELTDYEAKDTRWYVAPFHVSLPQNFSEGWNNDLSR